MKTVNFFQFNFIKKFKTFKKFTKLSPGRTLVAQTLASNVMSSLVADQVRFLCVEKKASINIPDAAGYFPIHHVVNQADTGEPNLAQFPGFLWEAIREKAAEFFTSGWEKGVNLLFKLKCLI